MPVKIGGGHQLQPYDSSNGRYGGGEKDASSNYKKGHSQISDVKTYPKEGSTSRIMPNYKKAITPDEKFLKYSLDFNNPNGRDKAVLYEKLLGYTKENYLSLKNQIHVAIISGTASLLKIHENKFGVIKYAYGIEVTGANGRTATVVAVYGIEKTSKEPRMITNYIK